MGLSDLFHIVMAFSGLLLLSLSSLVTVVSSDFLKHDWDHFVFTQQWPMSVCIESSYTHEHECRIPRNVTTWTVHGVWPSEGATVGPEFCNKSAKFNHTEIEDMLPELEVRWPNLYVDEPPDDFWKHEWEKHGTCSMTMPSLNSERKYFSAGLDLSSKYDLLKILSNDDISPRDEYTYQLSDIIGVLSHRLGHVPAINCFYHKETKTQYIVEIELCLDKTFNSIECPKQQQRPAVFTYEQDGKVSMVQRRAFMAASGERQRCADTEPVAYTAIHHN